MFNIFRKAKRAIAEHNEFSRVVRELSAMTDRDLADIGISRGDIEFIATQATKNKSKAA